MKKLGMFSLLASFLFAIAMVAAAGDSQTVKGWIAVGTKTMNRVSEGATWTAVGADPITNPMAQSPSRGKGKATTVLLPKRERKFKMSVIPFRVR